MATITTKIQRLLKQTARMKTQATKSFLRTLKQIDQERRARTADLDQAAHVIGQQLAELGHKFTHTTKSKPAKATTSKKKKRVRRSPEQLKAEATKVLAMIRSAGKDGIGGAKIRKSVPGAGQNIKEFIQKHTGVRLKTTGAKASMKYHVG